MLIFLVELVWSKHKNSHYNKKTATKTTTLVINGTYTKLKTICNNDNNISNNIDKIALTTTTITLIFITTTTTTTTTTTSTTLSTVRLTQTIVTTKLAKIFYKFFLFPNNE